MAKRPQQLTAEDRVPQDVAAEKALLSLVFVHGLDELVEQLDAADFFDDLHRWAFKELRLMWEAGIPLDCGAAAATWFTSPQCAARAKEAGLKERPSYLAAVTFREEFCSLAHKDYLLRRVRGARLERQLLGLCSAALKFLRTNPGEPVAALQRLQNGLGKLFGMAADFLPEALECDA